MTSIADNFHEVRARIAAACAAAERDPDEVQLLAVSKFHPTAAVREAMAAGQRRFGESRVQELVAKASDLQEDGGVRWHLIGSLQTNKVRDVVHVANLELVHSVDRRKLANALQQELERAGRQLDVLLQVNASGEEQKHGCSPDDAAAFLEHMQSQCTALRCRGLMAMGPLEGASRPVFDRVVALREQLRARSGLPLLTLSLGMSGDLDEAIAAGSTMVRIGTALFGARD